MAPYAYRETTLALKRYCLPSSLESLLKNFPKARSLSTLRLDIHFEMLRKRILQTNVKAGLIPNLMRYYSGTGLTEFSRDTPTNTVIKFVPQQEAWLVERMGKYHRTLEPGLNFLFPFLDRIAYVQSLKEHALEVHPQSAITADNVNVKLDGILYYRVFNAFDASYKIENAQYALSQLAMTAMRSEIGQLTLDNCLSERQLLNERVNLAISDATKHWGIECLRYEIKDIQPPLEVLEAMHRQVSAERSKRAEILESEGNMQAVVNMAEAQKRKVLLEAEGTAKGLQMISQAIETEANSKDAIALQVAERYVEAFSKIAKEGNTIVVPANLGELGSMVASGMKIVDTINQSAKQSKTASS